MDKKLWDWYGIKTNVGKTDPVTSYVIEEDESDDSGTKPTNEISRGSKEWYYEQIKNRKPNSFVVPIRPHVRITKLVYEDV